MSAWPTKQQFSDFLNRLAPLENKAGHDAPWAYIDHFNYDVSSGNWGTQYLSSPNPPVPMRSQGSDYSGLLRLNAQSGYQFLSYVASINLFMETEVRFRAAAGSSFVFGSEMRSPNVPSWHVGSAGQISTLMDVTPIQAALPDVWHTWRITVTPNKVTLARSDGPPSAITINTADSDQHGELRLYAQGDGNGPFQVDVDYFAWRPLPEAPLPVVNDGGGLT